MAKDNLLVGLDIGSTKIAATCGKIVEGTPQITGFVKVPNNGVRRGTIVDIEDTVSAISEALEQLERVSGSRITSATVGIGGSHISTHISEGVVAVARADGEIGPNDVNRVLEAARTVAMPPNREIIHVVPLSYTVDGQEGIDDPVGMTGIRLEAKTIVLSAASSAIKNLTKCVYQSGLEVQNLVFAPLATAGNMLSKKQKEIGAMLLDIGGGTTSLVVYSEGSLLHAAVIPIGSSHITNDLAIGLRTSVEIAEKIKTKYASAIPDKIRESEIVSLSQFDERDNQRIERKYISEIVQARLGEIFALINADLKKISKEGMLPAGVVLTGGGSKLEDLLEATKEELRLPVELGENSLNMVGFVDKLNDPVYATSVSLFAYALEQSAQNPYSRLNNGKGIYGKAKNFFKQFLP